MCCLTSQGLVINIFVSNTMTSLSDVFVVFALKCMIHVAYLVQMLKPRIILSPWPVFIINHNLNLTFWRFF